MSSVTPSKALLIIIGEPLVEEHVNAILGRVTEGLSTWRSYPGGFLDHDQPQLNLVTELRSFFNQHVVPEDLDSGGLLLRHSNANLYLEILISPTVQTLQASLSHFLILSAPYKHIIHAGPAFAGSGSWILQDGTWSLYDFSRLFHRADVTTALTEITPGSTVCVSCFPEGEWNEQGVKKRGLDKLGHIFIGELGENGKADDLHACFRRFISFRNLETTMPTSKVVGSIRFRRPTMHIFPAGKGEAALLGVNGFTILLDGGFARKPCFWDFLHHVDRADALLISRLNSSNIIGISSFVERLATGCSPKLGYAFGNVPARHGTIESGGESKSPLLLSTQDYSSKLCDHLAQSGLHLHSLSVHSTSKQLEPLTLFQKVGQGRLDMYVLNPAKDGKELQEFTELWKKGLADNGSSKATAKPGTVGEFLPSLSDQTSIAVLLVWHPSDPSEHIVRVLYPGGCPQAKLLHGLDKLKHLTFLRHSTCTAASLDASSNKVASHVSATAKKPMPAKSLEPAKTAPVAANSVSTSKPTAKAPAVAAAPVAVAAIAPAVPKVASTIVHEHEPQATTKAPLVKESSPHLRSETVTTSASPVGQVIGAQSNLIEVGEEIGGMNVPTEPATTGVVGNVGREMVEAGVLCFSADHLHDHATDRSLLDIEEPSLNSSSRYFAVATKDLLDSPAEEDGTFRGQGSHAPAEPTLQGSPHPLQTYNQLPSSDDFGFGTIEPPPSLSQLDPNAQQLASSLLNPEAPVFVPKHGDLSPSLDHDFGIHPLQQPLASSPMDPFSDFGGGGKEHVQNASGFSNGSTSLLDDSPWPAMPSHAAPPPSLVGIGDHQPASHQSSELIKKNVDDAKKEWGEPMGLPTPLPVGSKTSAPPAKSSASASAASRTNQASRTDKTTATSTAATGRAKAPPSAKPPTASESAKPPLANESKVASASTKKPAAPLSKSGTASAKEPAGSSVAPKSTATKPAAVVTLSKTAAAKPAAAAAAASAAPKPTSTSTTAAKPSTAAKKPGPPPISYYVDLAYIPHQGNPHFCNADFFKQIRSKHYVLSTLHPSKEILEAFLDGKKSWNLPEEEVSLIPTYDSDTLSLWMGLHKEELASESIDVAPSCCRCTVTLEEHQGAKCAAYRLEL